MDERQLREITLTTLCSIAPEVEPGEIRPSKPLRQQVDLDSMDWLNFLVALHERLSVEIPEADYARLVTLDDVVGYLARKLGVPR